MPVRGVCYECQTVQSVTGAYRGEALIALHNGPHGKPCAGSYMAPQAFVKEGK